MKTKNELKEIDIKNHVFYYFDDGSKLNFNDILLYKKFYRNISVYYISYKTPTDSKPLHIRSYKIHGVIKSLDYRIKHLILFNYGLFNKICDKIKYLISKKKVEL